MAVTSNKGIPYRAVAHFCEICKTHLVREWNGKHLALCSLEELEEALKSLDFRNRKPILDPGCAPEIQGLISLKRGFDTKLTPETAEFAIKEDCILYIFRGVRGFISRDEVPEGSTKIFIEFRVDRDIFEQTTTAVRWFTDVTATNYTLRPWRLVGSLDLNLTGWNKNEALHATQ